MIKVFAYIDGASSGNPGPAGAGVYIVDEFGREKELLFFLGCATNNIAEYMAFILCLEEISSYEQSNKLTLEIYSDSELLVKQFHGDYKIRNQQLSVLSRKANGLIRNFLDVKLEHISREKNKKADSLAKRAIYLARLTGQSSCLSD